MSVSIRDDVYRCSKNNYQNLDPKFLDQEENIGRTLYENYSKNQPLKLFIDIDIKNQFQEKDTQVLDDILYKNYGKYFYISKSHRYVKDDKESLDKTGIFKVSYHMVHKFMYFESIDHLKFYAISMHKSKILDMLSNVYTQIYKKDFNTNDVFDERIYGLSYSDSTRCMRCLYQKKDKNDKTYSTPLVDKINLSDMLITYIKETDKLENVFLPITEEVKENNDQKFPYSFKLIKKICNLIGSNIMSVRETRDEKNRLKPCYLSTLFAIKDLATYFPDKEDNIFDLFFNLAGKCSGNIYPPSIINKDWRSNKHKQGITWKSLLTYAKLSDPEEYGKLIDEIKTDNLENRKLFLSNDTSYLFKDFVRQYLPVNSYKTKKELYTMLYDLQKVFGFTNDPGILYIFKFEDVLNDKCSRFKYKKIMLKHEVLGKPVKILDMPKSMSIINYIVNYCSLLFLYDGIVFEQDQDPECRIVNLFQGFVAKKVEYKEENISLYKDFVDNVICSKDENTKKFIYQYMAQKLTNPCNKNIVVPVLYSKKQGTGKNTFVNILTSIIGENYVYETATFKKFSSKFNGFLSGKIFAVINEASKTGSNLNDMWDSLKSLISEKTVNIEYKGLDQITIKNVLDFIVTTNNLKSVKLESTDRRYAIIEVSDIHVRDNVYFTKLINFCKENLNEIYSYIIDQYDKSIYLPNIIPKTSARNEVINDSIDDTWRFLKYLVNRYDILYTPTESYELYKEWCKIVEGKTYIMKQRTYWLKINKFGIKKITNGSKKVYNINKENIEQIFNNQGYQVLFKDYK